MQTQGKGLGVWVSCLLLFVFATHARATVVRAIGLKELVAASDHVVVATATQARSHYEYVGGARRVVTDTELRVEQVVFSMQLPPAEGMALTVRTSGGTLGDVVHHVSGEAQLSERGMRLLFLRMGSDGHYRVTGRAQGEYRLSVDEQGSWMLHPSRGLDAVLNGERSTVRALAGRTLTRAADLILQVGTQCHRLEGTR